MFGSDFIHITDHRGFESGFWWSDILTVIGVYPEPDDGEEDWVKVKFRSDRQPDLHIVMSMTEFFEQVEKQLGAGLPAPSYITPNPVAIAPLLNPYKDGPSDKVEMP